MKNLKKHFEENYQLLLTNSQLVEIARAALEDCEFEMISKYTADSYNDIYNKLFGSHITEPELSIDDLEVGEWYFANLGSILTPILSPTIKNEWIFKFKKIEEDVIQTYEYFYVDDVKYIGYESDLCDIIDIKSIRPATREEIVKYFPHEFEIDSHGGNDIPRVTDEQL